MTLERTEVLILCVTMATLLGCSDDNGNATIQQGAWFSQTLVLTQITLSPIIDVNNDNATSANRMDEIPCVEDILILAKILNGPQLRLL
ncbi:MAG: hypothetical protein ACFB0A_01685 [Croceivirga sp.]